MKIAIVNLDDKLNQFDDVNLKEDLLSCQHLFPDCDFERARHKIFKYAIENLNLTIVDNELDHFFNN